jgi:hypothetical protein
MEEYSFIEEAAITGYKGGYPVVEFTLNEKVWGLVKDKNKFKSIIRTSEMEGGIEVGVSICFRGTASIDWNPPKLTLCGYPEVISRMIKKLI